MQTSGLLCLRAAVVRQALVGSGASAAARFVPRPDGKEKAQDDQRDDQKSRKGWRLDPGAGFRFCKPVTAFGRCFAMLDRHPGHLPGSVSAPRRPGGDGPCRRAVTRLSSLRSRALLLGLGGLTRSPGLPVKSRGLVPRLRQGRSPPSAGQERSPHPFCPGIPTPVSAEDGRSGMTVVDGGGVENALRTGSPPYSQSPPEKPAEAHMG